MRTIYLNAEFKCSPTQRADTVKSVETAVFDGKCAEYIEGYRFVPDGETWVREDGVEFAGEMIAPWKPYAELDAAQRAYEQQLLTEYAAALEVMGVKV